MASYPFELDPLEEYQFSTRVVNAFTNGNLAEACVIRERHRTSAFWFGLVAPYVMNNCVLFKAATVQIHRQTHLATGHMDATVILRDGDATLLRNYPLDNEPRRPRPLDQTTALHDVLIRTALTAGLEFDPKSAEEYGRHTTEVQAGMQYTLIRAVPVG